MYHGMAVVFFFLLNNYLFFSCNGNVRLQNIEPKNVLNNKYRFALRQVCVWID